MHLNVILLIIYIIHQTISLLLTLLYVKIHSLLIRQVNLFKLYLLESKLYQIMYFIIILKHPYNL